MQLHPIEVTLSTTQASSRLVLLILVNAWMKNDGYTSLLPPGVVRESLHINDGTAAKHNFKQKHYQIDDLALIIVKLLWQHAYKHSEFNGAVRM